MIEAKDTRLPATYKPPSRVSTKLSDMTSLSLIISRADKRLSAGLKSGTTHRHECQCCTLKRAPHLTEARTRGLYPLRLRPRTAYRSDRKSTRLNSSHEWISYAVFCLKKK